MLTLIKNSFFATAVLVVFSHLASDSIGQIIDPGVPVDQPPVVIPTDDLGNPGGQVPGSSISDLGDNNLDLSESLGIEISPDTRNQGFIGATAPGIQEFGFVGAASENSGPPLAEGATFGGGVNDSGGSGGGGARGTAAGGGQGFGPAGAQNGFTVIRRNLRTRLRPRYDARQVSPGEISSRFNNRFYRLPESDNFAGQFTVAVANRRATVTGAVNSQQESDRIVRQLRLEPGVYSIDNQLRILNQ